MLGTVLTPPKDIKGLLDRCVRGLLWVFCLDLCFGFFCSFSQACLHFSLALTKSCFLERPTPRFWVIPWVEGRLLVNAARDRCLCHKADLISNDAPVSPAPVHLTGRGWGLGGSPGSVFGATWLVLRCDCVIHVSGLLWGVELLICKHWEWRHTSLYFCLGWLTCFFLRLMI